MVGSVLSRVDGLMSSEYLNTRKLNFPARNRTVISKYILPPLKKNI